MTVFVGADPELFVKEGDRFVSGFGMIPGDKKKPHPVPNGAVQVDGMALEFNINPAVNEDEFLLNIDIVLNHLKGMIPDKHQLVVSPTAEFDEEYLKSQPLEALQLGCAPDYNAYEMAANPQPDQHPTMRTGAGHLHVGWEPNRYEEDRAAHREECAMLTKQMDYILGIPSILLDKDDKRRQMYGKAGAFRPKPYGVEYRVLSNFWLVNKNTIKWAYRSSVHAFNLLVYNEIYLPDMYGDTARNIIDNNDVHGAKDFIMNCGNWILPLPNMGE